jgi:hypothetical protein
MYSSWRKTEDKMSTRERLTHLQAELDFFKDKEILEHDSVNTRRVDTLKEEMARLRQQLLNEQRPHPDKLAPITGQQVPQSTEIPSLASQQLPEPTQLRPITAQQPTELRQITAQQPPQRIQLPPETVQQPTQPVRRDPSA